MSLVLEQTRGFMSVSVQLTARTEHYQSNHGRFSTHVYVNTSYTSRGMGVTKILDSISDLHGC